MAHSHSGSLSTSYRDQALVVDLTHLVADFAHDDNNFHGDTIKVTLLGTKLGAATGVLHIKLPQVECTV